MEAAGDVGGLLEAKICVPREAEADISGLREAGADISGLREVMG